MDKNDDDVHVSFITLLLLVQQYNFYNIINNSTFKDHLRVHIVQISERGREKNTSHQKIYLLISMVFLVLIEENTARSVGNL